MSFFFQFVILPCLSALCASTAAAPLGGIISWRRLIYFGEALSHSAWLGIALSLIFGLPIYVGIWSSTVFLIILLLILKRRSTTDANNILGTISHAMLALGVIVLSKLENIRSDLFIYLFGDILNTKFNDFLLIFAATVISMLVLKIIWNQMILLTINEEMAKAENPHIFYYEIVFLIILGFFTGIMMQFIGLLLVMSFFIIPIQIATKFATTPEKSIKYAIFISWISVITGISLSYILDIPVAPAIVAIMIIPYLFVNLFVKNNN